MSPLFLGLAAGAAGAFFMDPQQGRRRRALARDQMVRGVRETREFRDAATKDLRARAQGAAASLRAMRGGPISDEVLVGRVRSRLGRHVSHPHAIRVVARDGCVTLTGNILANEHGGLVRACRMVSGIADVEDRLDVHSSAEGISSLQGGRHWAPGTRAVVGGAGALLVLYALVRGGVLGVAAIAGGAALLARAKANRPLGELMSSGTERELRSAAVETVS